MSRLAANPAASPSLSPQTAETAFSRLMTHYFGEKWPSCWVGLSHSTVSAIAPNFCSQRNDENFGPVCVCRYVSRLLLGHCFGVIPSPGGTAPLCFGFAALRVMVPPERAPSKKARLGAWEPRPLAWLRPV
jgi:hypothetical protein